MDLIPFKKEKHQQIWDDYVASHPMGCIYHISAWSDIIKETYGWQDQYFLIYESGELKGILPFFKMRTLSQSSYYISLPFTAYSGPLLSYETDKIAFFFSCLYILYRRRPLGVLREIVLARKKQAICITPIHESTFVLLNFQELVNLAIENKNWKLN